ncbi:uncharacterized protein LOC110626346 [Manihot esculenta]|uniref:Epidermal patterning factor-like protein n=1 Tax=Manihot esculenta TaxID=3983 RepID=A0A2C9UXU6_MANES|nr:uncharacterized protein LOC110626346 [Manihot esculenta]OAY36482.1 hypothetical protein MANES_11G024300v8 [Manihot esculenta]
MEARLCCFVLALQIMSFVSGTSRPFAPNNGVAVDQPGQSQSPQVILSSNLGTQMGSKQDSKSMGEEGGGLNEDACTKGLNKIGSSPPSCEHKCFGCRPCQAIQVPTTSKTHSHLGVNYANYEPEGWKCKCGPSFYSP